MHRALPSATLSGAHCAYPTGGGPSTVGRLSNHPIGETGPGEKERLSDRSFEDDDGTWMLTSHWEHLCTHDVALLDFPLLPDLKTRR